MWDWTAVERAAIRVMARGPAKAGVTLINRALVSVMA